MGAPEFANYKEIAIQMNYIENSSDKDITTKTALKRFIECDHVYETIPIFQDNICTKGYKWIDLIQSYLILSIFVYLISFSLSRAGFYLQKKIDEKKDVSKNVLLLN